MKGNIIVNKSQSSNPLLKSFAFPYSFSSSILPDFQINSNIDCYFLSLRYHKQFPTYISTRLLQINSSSINFLFCLFDISIDASSHFNINSNSSIKMNFLTNLHLLDDNSTDDNLFNMLDMETNSASQNDVNENIEQLINDINILCIEKGITLIIGFTNNEIAQDIHALSIINMKVSQTKTKSEIGNEELINSVTSIDGINKNDAANLLVNFKDIQSICNANERMLSLIPKLNDNKVKTVFSFFNTELN